MTNRGPARRGAMLAHPVAVGAVVALLLNDHVLKAAAPGFLTGKASDVAGLAFFPLLLAEATAFVVRRDARRLVPAAAALTACVFALVKLVPEGASTLAWALGAGQWLVVLGLTGHAELRPVAIAADPTDVVAIPAVLVAVAVSRGIVPGWPVSAAPWARSPGRQFAPLVMAAAMGVATMATTSSAPPSGVVVSEQLRSDVTVRHVVWSVRGPAADLPRLSLEASTRAIASDPNGPPSTIEMSAGPDYSSMDSLRIVPDDAGLRGNVRRDGTDYSYSTVSLDLAGACADGCTGGARVFASQLPGWLVIRLTTGDPGDDARLSLRDDGVGDYAGPLATAHSDPQEAQIELDHVRQAWHGAYTLHVSAAALQTPLANARVILRTRIAGVDDKAGMGADATLRVGTLAMPIDLGAMAQWHVIDLSDQCRVGTPCDIPTSLAVTAAPAPPPYVPPGQSPGPAPTPGRGVDVYRWSVRVEAQWFDGREIPASSLWITPWEP